MSIFLLKNGFSSENSLVQKHGLLRVTDADAIPASGDLWTAGLRHSTPWWQGYFGLPDPQKSANLGAILFLEVENRTFGLTFGQVSSRLKDECYEYDFGLRVSLNAVDPEKLKSTDVSEPGAGRRQRTQTGVDSALTFFDFDSDSGVMRSVTGKARKEHENLVKQVTGSTNLRIGTSVAADSLGDLCEKLLALYESEDYVANFPGIENLQPVRDPQLIKKLDGKIDAFAADSGAFLMLPEVVDYSDDVFYRFSGSGSSLMFGELDIANFQSHLEANEVSGLKAEDLRRIRVSITDSNGDPKRSYSVYRCLNLELLSDDGDTFILHDGSWYLARKTLVEEMADAVASITRTSSLPAYIDSRESEYNERVADGVLRVNLDQTNIAGTGRTPLEPADLLSIEDGCLNLYHVKVSTRSSDLSHLFNQGLNSVQLLLAEDDAGVRLQSAVDDRANEPVPDLAASLKLSNFAVRYVIATHRDFSDSKFTLPFFSQITLWRAIRGFKVLRVPVTLEYVHNTREKKAAKDKPRKERSDKGSKRK